MGVLRGGANRLNAADLPALARLLGTGRVSSRIARDVLARAAQSGEAPVSIV